MAKDTIEAEFDLPPDLAKKYKKSVVIFDIPKSTPLEERESVANKMYQQWAMNEMSIIPQEQTPSVEKVGVIPAMYAGLKKSGSDILGGIQQLGYEAIKENPLTSQNYQEINNPLNQKIANLQQSQAQKQAEYEKIRAERPIAAPVGESLPYLALRSPYAVGGIEALKYGDAGERVVRGAGAGIATGLGNILGSNVAKYFNPQVAPTTLNAIKNVKDMGINPRLSELTGSKTLSDIEDVVMQSPLGGSLSAKQGKNQTAYNRVAAKSIGVDADNLGDDVLSLASKNISGIYGTVKTLPVDAAPIRFTKSIESEADKIIKKSTVGKTMKQPSVVDPQLLSTAQAWKDMSKKGEFFSADDYVITRENLSNLAWEAEGSAKIDYRNLLNALDDAAEESLSNVGLKDVASQLKTARSQYANLKTLEKGNVVENGNVDIKKLRNAIKQGRESAYKEGRIDTDLGKLSKYSEATAPLREGSQTAKRGFYQTLLQNPVTEIPMAGVNTILAKILASPTAAYIPSQLAGTEAGNIIGGTISRGAKIPSIQAEQDLIQRRLYGNNTGLLYQQ